MKDQESEDTSVRGERGSATLAQAPSVQSRISNVLAIGLMSCSAWECSRGITPMP